MAKGKTSSRHYYPTSSPTSSVPDFDHLISRSSTMERRGKNKKSPRSSSYVVPETPPARNTTRLTPEEAVSVWNWQAKEESKYKPSPPRHPARGMDRIPFAREVKTIASIEHVPAAQRPPRRSTTASSQSDNFSEYLPTPASSIRGQASRKGRASRRKIEARPSIYTTAAGYHVSRHITEMPRYFSGLRLDHPDVEHFKKQLGRQLRKIEREAAILFDGDSWSMSGNLGGRLEKTYRQISDTREVYKDLLRNDLLKSNNKIYRLVKHFWSACDDRLAELCSLRTEACTPTQSTRSSGAMKDGTNWIEKDNVSSWKRQSNSFDIDHSQPAPAVVSKANNFDTSTTQRPSPNNNEAASILQRSDESNHYSASMSVYQQAPSSKPATVAFSHGDISSRSAHQPDTSVTINKPGWNKASGGYRSPETQDSGIAVVINRGNPLWHKRHYPDKQKRVTKPSRERFPIANRQSMQPEHVSANKSSSCSHAMESSSTELSKISSIGSSSVANIRLPISSTTKPTNTEKTSDIAPHEEKPRKRQLGSEIETIPAQSMVQSSFSASHPDCDADKVHRKRKHDREASDMSVVSEVSSSPYKKRKKISSTQAAKSRHDESPDGARIVLTPDLAASSSSPLLKPSKKTKSKEKQNRSTRSDASNPPTSGKPLEPAVEIQNLDSHGLPVPKIGEEDFPRRRRKKRKPVPHLDVADVKSPESPSVPQCSNPDKRAPLLGEKRKRDSVESISSTSPSERKKLKQFKVSADYSRSKKIFPKVGSSEAEPSRQDKGKGKEVVTAPYVANDSCAETFNAFNSFLDSDFPNSADKLVTLGNKTARNDLPQMDSTSNLHSFRSQTMPPIGAFKPARPSIRDTIVLDSGNFMETLNDKIKQAFNQSISQMQASSQSAVPTRVTSGPPPLLASANHHEILRYYGGREEPFNEDQLVEIIKNPVLTGMKRYQVAEHAFSTTGSVRASYRHLQARLTEAEWARVTPKRKRPKD